MSRYLWVLAIHSSTTLFVKFGILLCMRSNVVFIGMMSGEKAFLGLSAVKSKSNPPLSHQQRLFPYIGAHPTLIINFAQEGVVVEQECLFKMLATGSLLDGEECANVLSVLAESQNRFSLLQNCRILFNKKFWTQCGRNTAIIDILLHVM